MIIAIIPARKGSKRILNKNIKKFNGKPIISYSIQTALKSNLFDEIIVSTDSSKIAKISKYYGATVPFKRPKILSNNSTTTHSVIKHAIKKMILNKKHPKYICCLYPTSPLITEDDLKESFKLLKKYKPEFVFAASKCDANTTRSFTIKKNKKIERFIFKKNNMVNSQKLLELYCDAGQFYWGTISSWLNNDYCIVKNSLVFDLPKWKSIDINEIEDFKFAEIVYKGMKLYESKYND